MNLPLIGIGLIIGTVVLFAGGNKMALEKAAKKLETEIDRFQIHSVDLRQQTFDVKLKVTFSNPTQSIIPLSNLLVRLNIPVKGKWHTLSASRPIGKLNISQGKTTQEFRFTTLIDIEIYNLFKGFIKGNKQELQVEAFPQFAEQNLSPVRVLVKIDPREITLNFLKKRLGLGLVAISGNKIKSNTSRYSKFFPPLSHLKNTNPIVSSGSTFETLAQMQRIVKKTLHQTAKIARHLKKENTVSTLQSVFKFANENFNYCLDTPGTEQLRQPLASWRDRHQGIDCDCYSILISSILTNLNISHSFRKAKYNSNKVYSHVYVVAHVKNKDYVLDPVVGKFNEEHPYSSKYTEKVV